MLDNLFTVVLLIALTIAVASVLILLAGRAERPGRGGWQDDEHVGADRSGVGRA